MGKPFLICNALKFKEVEYHVPIQEELDIGNEGTPEIYIKPNSMDFYDNFNQYLCHHEYKHNRHGRIKNQTFNYYFEPVNFYTYYNPSKELCFIQLKTDMALDFKDQLNFFDEYNLDIIDIDFVKMYPKLPHVSGAWVGQLKDTNVKTKAFYGYNVHMNKEFKDNAEEGKVSSISFNFKSDKTNNEHHITISRKGSITIYDSFETLEEELNLIIEIYNKLII